MLSFRGSVRRFRENADCAEISGVCGGNVVCAEILDLCADMVGKHSCLHDVACMCLLRVVCFFLFSLFLLMLLLNYVCFLFVCFQLCIAFVKFRLFFVCFFFVFDCFC